MSRSAERPRVVSAIRVVQEHLPWVIQVRKKGEVLWQYLETKYGKRAARSRLNELKRLDPNRDMEYRSIPKNEADAYMQGVKAGSRGRRSQVPWSRR